MSFCPVCGAHHDPKMPCADRAGELLRDVGVNPAPLGKKKLNKTIKKANRSLVVLLFVVLSLFFLSILISYFNILGVDAETAWNDIKSGNYWLQNGDFDRAIADYTEVITSKRLSKEYPSIAYYNRGLAWQGKKNYEKAFSDFSDAIRLNPRSVAYFGRGLLWYQKRDYNKAIADFNDAIRLNAEYADAYMARGITRFNKGEFQLAASDLGQSLHFKADNYAAIWLYLARMRGNSDGKTELSMSTQGMELKEWPLPVAALYLGKADPSTVTIQAADPNPEKYKEQLCEANFFRGEWHLLRNENQQGLTFLTKAQDECPKESYQYAAAVSELQRLK